MSGNLSRVLCQLLKENPSVTPTGISRSRKVSLSVLSRVINGRQRFVSTRVLRALYLSFPEPCRNQLALAYLHDSLSGTGVEGVSVGLPGL